MADGPIVQEVIIDNVVGVIGFKARNGFLWK